VEQDVPETSGGGESWPSYDVPSEVPRDQPAETPEPAPGTPPGQPTGPTGGAAAAPAATDGDVIPKYRLDETIAQRDQYYALVERQQQQIDQLLARLGPQPPAAEAPPPPTPQDLQIRERLFQVFPELKLLDELKELAARKQDLLGAAQAVPQWRTAEAQYYDRYVERTIGAITDKLAQFTLGAGKTGKDVNPLVTDSLVGTFTKWIRNDPRRAARFEQEDPRLVEEFWHAYKAAHYDPIARDRNASLLERRPPAVPVGGGGAPVAGAPPRVDPTDEDAVHASAWAQRDSVSPR
jgi:hypothetical protein